MYTSLDESPGHQVTLDCMTEAERQRRSKHIKMHFSSSSPTLISPGRDHLEIRDSPDGAITLENNSLVKILN